MADPLRLAIGTLTALPVRPPGSIQPPVPGWAMTLAPVAGLVPGLTAALVGVGGGAVLTPFVTAVLVVATLQLATRGLHLDGLADTADGLAASYDRERALAVMRTGDTGPAGLAAVVLVLLLQTAALAEVLARARAGEAGGPAAGRCLLVVLLVAVVARVAIPVGCVRGVPAARPQGLGATVAGTVPPGRLVALLGLVATAGSAAGAAGGLRWWAGALAVVLVAAATTLVVRRAVARLGGITGDVIGATVEVGTAVALVTLSAVG